MTDRELFTEFKKRWSLENVKNMTLEQYTGLQSDGDRDDFCYWIESKLDELGSVWGGSAFKFGIYKRNDSTQKGHDKGKMYDKNYAWLEKYGKSPSEAFEKIKSLILQVIKASQNNDLVAIDSVDLGHAYKWKIAFHHQNPDDMRMFCIFSEQRLRELAKTKLNNPNLKIHEIYTQILEKFLPNKPYKFAEIFDLSKTLWEEFDEQSQGKSPLYWIFPSNPSEFDAVSHFKTHEQKSWEKKVANAKVGDIVFLYITKTDKEHSQSIAIKTKIIGIDESKPLPIMLEIDRLFTRPVPFLYLQEIGINGNIQGARNITKNQADKIYLTHKIQTTKDKQCQIHTKLRL